MAEIDRKNNKKIFELTDGVLIPDKNEKSLFSAWKISFFGAIFIAILLPLIPGGKINLIKIFFYKYLNFNINYNEIINYSKIKSNIFEDNILSKIKNINDINFIKSNYFFIENDKTYYLLKTYLIDNLEIDQYNLILDKIKDQKIKDLFLKSYILKYNNYILTNDIKIKNKLYNYLIKINYINKNDIIQLLTIIYNSNYYKNIFREILLFIPDGLFITFQVTIISILFSILIGLIIGLGRISRIIIINRLATIYVEIIRGIPLLMQLFYIYYALAKFINIPSIVSAILAMSICYGAYISEIFRGGILSIPKGQMEAALALGFTRTQALFRIIIPQAIRVILPPIGNEFIAMLKDSSLVSIIAVSDLLRRGREYASITFYYFETYSYIALVYLILTLFFSRLIAIMEERLNKSGK